MAEIRHLELGLIAAHEPEVGYRGLDHHVREGGHLAGQEVRQGVAGPSDTEQRMEVGAAEVGVDDDAPASARGEGRREVRADEGLPDPALPAAYRQDARSVVAPLERRHAVRAPSRSLRFVVAGRVPARCHYAPTH